MVIKFLSGEDLLTHVKKRTAIQTRPSDSPRLATFCKYALMRAFAPTKDLGRWQYYLPIRLLTNSIVKKNVMPAVIMAWMMRFEGSY